MSAGADQTLRQVPVLIVGGGLVGGLMALLLAQAGVAVTLLDAAPAVNPEALLRRDARVYALSPASIHLLHLAGVWQRVSRRADYRAMSVWHQDGRGRMQFGDLHPGAPPLGSMVEPVVLAAAMQAQLASAGVVVQHGVRVRRIERMALGWQVHAEGGWCGHTPLLIGADGARSLVRAQAGIAVRELDYRQSGLTAALRVSKPHGAVARQVFLPEGPLALLPLADLHDGPAGLRDHWVSMVWTLPSADAQAWHAADMGTLAQALTRHSEGVLGAIEHIESRGLFALQARQAQTEWLPGLALIGDAAHSIHPLAGQGVNLGLLDAAVLADSLLDDRERGLWAHDQALSRYARRRRLASSAMMHGMSMLGWLEKNHLPLWMVARDWGHQLVNRFTPLSQQITHAASGLPALTQTRYAVTDFWSFGDWQAVDRVAKV